MLSVTVIENLLVNHPVAGKCHRRLWVVSS